MPDHPRDAIREARRELDAVIEEIQALPGYETFLAPPTFEDVAVVATEAPLVYLAHAEPGGLALIVRDGDVIHVPLGDASTSAVRDRMASYLEAFAAYRTDPDAGTPIWNDELDRITEWLWDAVVAPVLDELDRDHEVVVIAGGLLGLLPLHAAWTKDATAPTGRKHALDEVVFSYAPNARAVAAARAIAERTAASRALVVVDPQPVSASALPSARLEALSAAASFPEAVEVLSGGEATEAAFRRAATTADVLHLACHGVAHLDAPLDSGLLLAGNRWVTLRDLFGMTLRVRLAVLSACETSLPGTDLPDEVVALPTGLLQAGVAGVIASQWSVPDLATAMLMIDFYRRRAEATPATALRDAQRWIRDTTNGEKADEWENALADGAAWLPPEVGDALVARLAFCDPAAQDQAELRNWAGFAHVGA